MVKYQTAALDATFSALADATRRAILARLASGEASVTELAAPFRMSLPAVSKHLNVLERAGLLNREKEGRVHRCRLSVRPLADAAEWIAFYRQFWEHQFDALESYLAEAHQEETKWPRLPKEQQRRRSKSGGRSPHHEKKYSKPGLTRK